MYLKVEPMSSAHKSPEQQDFENENAQRKRERARGIRRGQKALIRVKYEDETGGKRKRYYIEKELVVVALYTWHVSMKYIDTGIVQSFTYEVAREMIETYQEREEEKRKEKKNA